MLRQIKLMRLIDPQQQQYIYKLLKMEEMMRIVDFKDFLLLHSILQ